MAANFLTLCNFEEPDYRIIGIHTTLEDYKLAYLLNHQINFNFTRIHPDPDYVIESKKAFFSVFEFQDAKNLIDWYLISNKFKVSPPKGNSLGLFKTEEAFASSYVYLQPEVKEADFLIKIQGDFLDSSLKILLQKVNQIKGVVTAYSVDTHKLNHKEYLIF